MVQAFVSIFKLIIDLFKYPFYFILGSLTIFVVMCSFFITKDLIKGRRFKKGIYRKVEKSNLIKKLFWETPKQFVEDLFNQEPDFFKTQGMIIFEGRQGTGKTMSMVQYIQELQKQYPKSKVITNFGFKGEDDVLEDWNMLIDYKNGKKGVIVGMDELQNWFSSNDSRNFPPEMLSVITQNRKNRRVILGTSQNFYLLAKAIRSQATEVRRCATFLGCFTIVRRFEPILDSEGNVVEFKRRGMYCYVHNEELRKSYDTWQVIENLKKSGFKENTNLNVNETNNIYVIEKNKKRGILRR